MLTQEEKALAKTADFFGLDYQYGRTEFGSGAVWGIEDAPGQQHL